MDDSFTISMRILCDAKCVFVFRDQNYEGVIENISLTGALIKLSEAAVIVNPGEECGLMLCEDADRCPVKYICRIVRCDANRVGVQFVEIDHNI